MKIRLAFGGTNSINTNKCSVIFILFICIYVIACCDKEHITNPVYRTFSSCWYQFGAGYKKQICGKANGKKSASFLVSKEQNIL